jgi:hypothetical protein
VLDGMGRIRAKEDPLIPQSLKSNRTKRQSRLC